MHAQTGTGEDVAGTLRAGVFVAQPLYGNTTIWTAEPPCRGRRDTVSLTAWQKGRNGADPAERDQRQR